MKEFVEYIVKNLVDNPDQVRINEIGGTHTLIIELSVEKSDIGKIIGKKGKTINAIRTLLMSVASRNGIRVNLEIIEDEDLFLKLPITDEEQIMIRDIMQTVAVTNPIILGFMRSELEIKRQKLLHIPDFLLGFF